jgi:hypothetical protein
MGISVIQTAAISNRPMFVLQSKRKLDCSPSLTPACPIRLATGKTQLGEARLGARGKIRALSILALRRFVRLPNFEAGLADLLCLRRPTASGSERANARIELAG